MTPWLPLTPHGPSAWNILSPFPSSSRESDSGSATRRARGPPPAGFGARREPNELGGCMPVGDSSRAQMTTKMKWYVLIQPAHRTWDELEILILTNRYSPQ